MKKPPLNPRLKKYPPSALRSYCDLMLGIPGHTLASARRELEEETGKTIRSSKMYEWLNGTVETPKIVRDYCRLVSIEKECHRIGIDHVDCDWDRLSATLS